MSQNSSLINILKKVGSETSSLILFTLGAVTFLYFFMSVETGTSMYVILIGVTLISLSTLLAIKSIRNGSKNIHFIFILYFMYLLLHFMVPVRSTLPILGGDIAWEFRTARTTLEQGTWLITRGSYDRFFSCISISLMPVIVSEISGIDLLILFNFHFAVITAILPVALFLAVKEAFGKQKLAALSTVIFAQLFLNFTLLGSLLRQQIAEIFLVLIFFVMFKLGAHSSANSRCTTDRKAYLILLFILFFSLVSSHYTVDYFSFPIFIGIFLIGLALMLVPHVLLDLVKVDQSQLKREGPIVNKRLLAVFFVFSFMWMTFVYMPSLIGDIYHEIVIITSPMHETHYQVKFAASNPTGPIITVWIDFISALIPIGFLYLIFKVKKDAKRVVWISGGFIMGIFMALWILPSFSSAGIFIDRVYSLGAPFFASFIAAPILFADKHVGYKHIKLVLVIFLLLNLPINMFLPAHERYVLYHKRNEVSPEVQVTTGVVGEAEFIMQVWIDKYTSNKVFLTPVSGQPQVFYIHSYCNETANPLSSPYADYIVLNNLNLRYELWRTAALNYTRISSTSLMNESSVVYNSGRAALISRLK